MELLPLFRKELLEQASQRRTYWVRAGYAVLSSAVVGFAVWVAYQQRDDWFEMLGFGRTLFEVLMWCGFIGIGVFLPALVANTIPAERESGAFDLLWLTRLTPTELVVEKLLSRLWPMLTLLLVGLPIGALTYSYGGITRERMVIGGYLLVMFAAQVGAWSMIWAVACKRSIPAFLAAVTSLVVLLFLLPGIVSEVVSPPPFATYYYFFGETEFVALLGESAVGWLPVLACLALARLILPRTVGTRPKGRQAGAAARRTTVVPREAPVAWRERHAVGFGGWTTGLVYLAFAVAVGVMLATEQTPSSDFGFGASIMFSAWGITSLCAIVRGVNLVTAERASQTLATLLTTPLTGREIMRQKMRGLMPSMCALVGLMWLLALVTECYGPPVRLRRWDGTTYVFAVLCLSVVYLPMYLHWGTLVGLRTKTRMRGLVLSLVGVFLWSVGPVVFAALTLRDLDRNAAWFVYTSPPVAVVSAEVRQSLVDRDNPLPEIVFVVLWHIGVIVLLRFLTLSQADRLLGRAPEAR